ncbi:hypothetical protein [Vulcanococcus limneticus]|uniref:hypothetical protein n=1 Tax=Vulcanococcus limneticus TaxID=2170428 RepID=UPI00398BD0B8
MSWNRFELDRHAQRIVLDARTRDPKSLNQAYKMRANCAYGLERFWGEHLRLKGERSSQEDRDKAAFIADVWSTLTTKILSKAGIELPQEVLSNQQNEATINKVAEQLWSLGDYERQVALAVLTNFCDAIVWWTQRLKGGNDRD